MSRGPTACEANVFSYYNRSVKCSIIHFKALVFSMIVSMGMCLSIIQIDQEML